MKTNFSEPAADTIDRSGSASSSAAQAEIPIALEDTDANATGRYVRSGLRLRGLGNSFKLEHRLGHVLRQVRVL